MREVTEDKPGIDLRLNDVHEILRSAPRPMTAVCLGEDDGRLPPTDNVACLERGSYHDLRTFGTESEACADFLGMLGLSAP